MSTVGTNTKKDLIRFLLGQVKARSLDVAVAKRYIAALSEEQACDSVAVVGLACRFPGARDKNEFWANLLAGRESIGPFPSHRLEDYRRVDSENGQLRNGGYLDRIDLFDAEYFGLPPKYVMQMDPYHRILMEVLVETGDDAGYPRSALTGSSTGIFVGTDHTHRLNHSYLHFLSEIDFPAITGSWSSILASRLSYLFNLHGPAAVVDTGCSSGLVALDTAAKALRAGDCDMAFVAAINLFLDPTSFGDETSSPHFQARPFDAGADGTVWSEGVASILIKPLSQALQDRDHIYGVLLASAINSDGRSNGLTAPNAQAQTELLLRAWRRANIPAESISYLEAHGTGTVLGDPIELKGLSAAFRQSTERRQFCAMGSVKSNIGHTVGAAGLASLAKVLLCLDHGQLPPSINFDVPNAFLDLADSPVYMVDRKLDWQQDGPRRAGVSSFSLSGTNAHVVVEEGPKVKRSPTTTEAWVYPLTARTAQLLAEFAGHHLAILEAQPDADLDDACFSMQHCRDHQEVRAAIVCTDRVGLLAGLRCLSVADADSDGQAGETWAVMRPGLASPAIPALSSVVPVAEAFLAEVPDAFDAIRPERAQRMALPGQLFVQERFWDETPRCPASDAVPAESAFDLRAVLSGPSRIIGDQHPSEPRSITAAVWCEVLGFPRVHDDDDFFALGGDSISSLALTQLLNEVFDLAVPSTVLLDHPCFADLADTLEKSYGLTKTAIVSAGQTAAGRQERAVFGSQATADDYELPLTPGQRAMFLEAGLAGESVSYNVTGITMSRTPILAKSLWDGLAALVRRHDSLRATFHLLDGQPVQRIHAEVPLEIEHVHLPAPQLGKSHEDTARDCLASFIRPFQLDAAPLFRVRHMEFDDGVSCTAVDVHHVVTDGTSMGVLIRDFVALAAGQQLPPLKLTYRDAVEELLARSSSSEMEVHRAYWQERFYEAPPQLQLPTDASRAVTPSGVGATLFTEVGETMMRDTKEFARAHGLTLNMLLLGVFHLLLARMSGQDDIVIGTPVQGRPNREFANVVGMFVNTLAVRFQTEGLTSVEEYIALLRAVVRDALAHQEFPFESLIESVNVPRAAGRRPLFDVYFAHQNSDMGLDREGERTLNFDKGTAKFDLTVTTREVKGRLLVDWEYDTALFQHETIERCGRRYVQLLSSLISSKPSTPLSELRLIGLEEETLLRSLAVPLEDHSTDVGLVELFERKVRSDPDKVALVFGEEELTYGALDTRANQVARGLISLGLAGGPVALLIERSLDVVTAILGVLKSGSYYVPLNTDFPQERLAGMLDDCAATVLITSTSCLEAGRALEKDDRLTMSIDECMARADEDGSPGIPSYADDPAYLMYTSGTTGAPKGSLIRQRGILRVAWKANFYDANADDVFLMLSDYSFDGSVFDMYSALLNGGRLIVLDQDTVLNLDLLGATIVRHGVTGFFVTTGLFNALVDQSLSSLLGVRKVVFGGEIASPEHVSRAFAALGPGRLSHAYGPTETTVFASIHAIERLEPGMPIPIGLPVNGTSLWVLDEAGQLQPFGAIGELYIGGRGLADGYLNRPELTAERFVEVPAVPGERLYRTGDFVRFTSEGFLSFVGRRDEQVKLRGFRIELADIIHSASLHPGVLQAHTSVVMVGSGRTLCLWVKMVDKSDDALASLRSAMQLRLPSFMVPTSIIAVDAFPLNKNGKIDVKRLPAPGSSAKVTLSHQTNMERKVLAVWEDVLGVPVPDVETNFFTLGGDSIKAIQIAARLKEAGITMHVPDLLKHQTVRRLAARLSTDVDEVFDQTPTVGPIEATPIQLAFLEQPDAGSLLFNQSLLVIPTEAIPVDDLVRAIEKVIRAHDLLRVRVDDDGNIMIREPDDDNLVAVRSAGAQLSQTEQERFVADLQRDIDVISGPAVGLGTGLGSDGAGFVMAIHHLAVDVVSWQIILSDLERCLVEPVVPLPQRTMRFTEWAGRLRRFAADGGYRSQTGYWRRTAALAAAAGDPFGSLLPRRGETLADSVCVCAADTERLLSAARECNGADAAQTVLSVMASAIAAMRHVANIPILLEGHGRELFEKDAEVSRTVGWFTSKFPVVIEVGERPTETLASVLRVFGKLPCRGQGFEPLYRFDKGLSSVDRAVLEALRPTISFNYLGDQSDSSQRDLQVLHLPSDITVDGTIHMPCLDVIGYCRDGELHIDVRLADGDVLVELLAAIKSGVQNYIADLEGVLRDGNSASFGVEPSVLDAVLSDMLDRA